MLYTIQAYAPKGNYNGFSMKVYTKNGEENGADENYFWIGSLEGNKRNREEKAKLKERNGSKKEENKKAGGIHAQFPAMPMLNFRRCPCSISGGFHCAAANMDGTLWQNPPWE